MRTAKKQTTPRLCIACSNFGCFLLTTDFVSHLQRNSKRLSRVRYFWAVRCSILASLRVPDWLVHDEVGHSNDLQNRKVIRVRHHRITAVQDRPRRSCLHLPASACLPACLSASVVHRSARRARVHPFLRVLARLMLFSKAGALHAARRGRVSRAGTDHCIT